MSWAARTHTIWFYGSSISDDTPDGLFTAVQDLLKAESLAQDQREPRVSEAVGWNYCESDGSGVIGHAGSCASGCASRQLCPHLPAACGWSAGGPSLPVSRLLHGLGQLSKPCRYRCICSTTCKHCLLNCIYACMAFQWARLQQTWQMHSELKEKKEQFMLFSDHNVSLLRRQPGAAQ